MEFIVALQRLNFIAPVKVDNKKVKSKFGKLISIYHLHT